MLTDKANPQPTTILPHSRGLFATSDITRKTFTPTYFTVGLVVDLLSYTCTAGFVCIKPCCTSNAEARHKVAVGIPSSARKILASVVLPSAR